MTLTLSPYASAQSHATLSNMYEFSRLICGMLQLDGTAASGALLRRMVAQMVVVGVSLALVGQCA